MRHGMQVALTDVCVSLGSATVLRNARMQLSAGDCVALMGPSGSGKSTLLACITGTRRPDSGRVEVGDTVISGLNTSARADIRRRRMGLIFQNPELLPELSIEENVALTLLFDGVARSTALTAARASLASVDMEGHAGKRTHQISVGEAQRVAVARALVRPEVSLVVADEPTASLDEGNARIVTRLLTTAARNRGVTILIATHDPAVAASCDRVLTVAQCNGGSLAA